MRGLLSLYMLFATLIAAIYAASSKCPPGTKFDPPIEEVRYPSYEPHCKTVEEIKPPTHRKKH